MGLDDITEDISKAYAAFYKLPCGSADNTVKLVELACALRMKEMEVEVMKCSSKNSAIGFQQETDEECEDDGY